MGHVSPALKDFAEAADFLRGAFSPDFEAIGEVTTSTPCTCQQQPRDCQHARAIDCGTKKPAAVTT